MKLGVYIWKGGLYCISYLVSSASLSLCSTSKSNGVEVLGPPMERIPPCRSGPVGLGPIMAFLYNVHFNVFSVYNALERRTPARMGVVIAVCAGVWGRAAGLELGVDRWVLVICLGGWGGGVNGDVGVDVDVDVGRGGGSFFHASQAAPHRFPNL